MSLTDQQQAFVDHLVATGCTPTEAARQAGYSYPQQEAYRLMRKPSVVREIQAEQSRLLGGELANVALGTLRAVMQDAQAPASARVAAARTVLDTAGWLKGDGADAHRLLEPAKMSIEQLEEFVRQRQGMVDVTPDREAVTLEALPAPAKH